jgi:cation diffusion facilitator family transporter
MSAQPLPDWDADHVFLGNRHAHNERRTWLVVWLCVLMMAAEIGGGTLFGSLALISDGLHMATHVGALLLVALAYRFARRHARDRRFVFGTGKFGDLAAFASAIVLGMIALLIAYEALARLFAPVPIRFAEALPIALAGLAVNVLSALLLRDGPAHQGHAHGHAHAERDNNIRSAYVHVLADAAVSVLVIIGLLLVRAFGWLWMDPLVGIVGALVIGNWSYGLARDAGGNLLDLNTDHETAERVRAAIEGDGDRLADLHLWRLGPGHMGALLSVSTEQARDCEFFRQRLRDFPQLSHVTVEVLRGGSMR